MTHFGKIASYDRTNGRGTIAPEGGGDVLSFRRLDLLLQTDEPEAGQRYGFQTEGVDGGKRWAVRLGRQQA